MLEEIQMEIEEKKKKGWPKKHWHMLREYHEQYFNDLADCAGCTRTPVYIHKLLQFSEDNAYQKYTFEILDDDNFQIKLY